ncbi:MAG: hypothetical protein LBU24_02440 [Methanocalculaceae archaeon]|jgi:hypothetical protein|nr:hypothetical protein [Methanocalculaceae archaeon]
MSKGVIPECAISSIAICQTKAVLSGCCAFNFPSAFREAFAAYAKAESSKLSDLKSCTSLIEVTPTHLRK